MSSNGSSGSNVRRRFLWCLMCVFADAIYQMLSKLWICYVYLFFCFVSVCLEFCLRGLCVRFWEYVAELLVELALV